MKPDLKFFRELRVSDPEFTRDASVSRYQFTARDGKKTDVELRYKFDTPVYAGIDSDAQRRGQLRLHHSIPSLNYGLFADRVVFDFPLTRADLDWHRAMQDVTAREQYLTRFVRDEPHLLILPEYHVPPDEFEPEAVKDLAHLEPANVAEEPPAPDAPHHERYGVLSSGGKESLLSYGMLRELGKDVYPIYVNESGRHWHTAVTSHRHHEAAEPRTRRVWTTVDRLYVAANRLLPCVRPDFQRVEADVYPIQLFTFHSYQQAAVTQALHEGITTLVFGNEFDEGPWPEVKGVRHYHGIYDQSQEFDKLATEFYASKGWGITQLSLVRAASSLIIEDLLATRYPDLVATQTSCHATHTKEGVVKPCGRCSKCLGVLMFLLAGGHDPTRLRYSPEDVAALGRRLAKTVIKVDEHEAEHALWLASKRGFEFEGSANGYEPRPHPEVEALRYDDDMSHRDNMPAPLAAEIGKLLMTRATGALEKRDGEWVPLDA